MITSQKINSDRPFWFVLSKIERRLDRFKPFVNQSYWEYFEDEVKENTRERYLKYLHEMQIGDLIAMYECSSETPDEFKQKYNIEIDETSISYLIIKAVGEITQPCNNNKTIGVSWNKVNDCRRWYSYTQNGQIWRVYRWSKDYWGENLIEFTFCGKSQDFNKLYHKVCSKISMEKNRYPSV